MDERPRRKPGTGTIAALPDGRYRVTITVRGRRIWRRARTYEEALERLAALKMRSDRGRTDGLRAHTRRKRAEAWILEVMAESRRQGWDDAYLARVLVAQLSPSRVKRAIFGPCVYCGSWIASTVDHVVPTIVGGTNDPSNLASACLSCNSRKGSRSADSLPISFRLGTSTAA